MDSRLISQPCQLSDWRLGGNAFLVIELKKLIMVLNQEFAFFLILTSEEFYFNFSRSKRNKQVWKILMSPLGIEPVTSAYDAEALAIRTSKWEHRGAENTRERRV